MVRLRKVVTRALSSSPSLLTSRLTIGLLTSLDWLSSRLSIISWACLGSASYSGSPCTGQRMYRFRTRISRVSPRRGPNLPLILYWYRCLRQASKKSCPRSSDNVTKSSPWTNPMISSESCLNKAGLALPTWNPNGRWSATWHQCSATT